MKLTVKAAKIKVDRKKVTKHAQEAIEAAVRDATREFYRTAFMSVPIKTGMARGSLIPLGRVIRNVPVTVVPVANPVVPYRPKAWYPLGKSLESGILRGEKAFKFTKDRYRFTFTYNIKVLHWIKNEPKWDALEKGMEDFKARLSDGRLSKELRGIFKFTITGG